MYYVGIDPGKKGGIAIIDSDNKIIYHKMLTNESLISWFLSEGNGKEVIACVEKVNAMHGQGVVSMFNFGKNAGFIEGALTALKIPYQLIPPQTWKKEFGLINKDKSDSIRVCRQLFPSANLFPTERCKKESDGLAESLLLACMARRHF